MKIELHEIEVREVFDGFKDSDEEGVVGYGGRLDIRPKYQREFIYDNAKRDAVIDTVRKGFPLNIMYWVRNSDGSFEVLDGQQRILSICYYLNSEYSINGLKYHNLCDDQQAKILDYRLMVYFCEGESSEKLDWFERINIAGEKLTLQELRNATFQGSWVTDAKRYFSKTNCAAKQIANDYMSGTPIRQDYLETAIKWISNGEIKEYMSDHQNDPTAEELWDYFKSVINWVKSLFTVKRKEMKSVEWGALYNLYKDKEYVSTELETSVAQLMIDDDVTHKSGIYEYLLSGKERMLNIRNFSENQKREAYERQEGICANCKEHFEFEQMEGDHITPWIEGGKTNAENCQMLCLECNRRKGGK